MCSRPPTPPPPPKPKPTAPAPEKTAKAVVTGTKRTKKNQPGSGLANRRRGGTSSLQIPMFDSSRNSNLEIK
tara:strand:- start:553 stop:768 length:216 start_codon:yes stop_codon:yes gene_type:complete